MDLLVVTICAEVIVYLRTILNVAYEVVFIFAAWTGLFTTLASLVVQYEIKVRQAVVELTEF